MVEIPGFEPGKGWVQAIPAVPSAIPICSGRTVRTPISLGNNEVLSLLSYTGRFSPSRDGQAARWRCPSASSRGSSAPPPASWGRAWKVRSRGDCFAPASWCPPSPEAGEVAAAGGRRRRGQPPRTAPAMRTTGRIRTFSALGRWRANVPQITGPRAARGKNHSRVRVVVVEAEEDSSTTASTTGRIRTLTLWFEARDAVPLHHGGVSTEPETRTP